MDITNRTDTNMINNSPTTLMSPIIRLPIDIMYNLSIPSNDIDGDYVRCRWSEWMKNECYGL